MIISLINKALVPSARCCKCILIVNLPILSKKKRVFLLNSFSLFPFIFYPKEMTELLTFVFKEISFFISFNVYIYYFTIKIQSFYE